MYFSPRWNKVGDNQRRHYGKLFIAVKANVHHFSDDSACPSSPGLLQCLILGWLSLQVRLWDFSAGRCVMVLSGHGQPTWGCSFHSSGQLLASCSADRTAKLWDLESQCCQLTLRGHTASVNSVSFLPFSNLLLTASADQTLSVWDTRLGFCMVTFHGHQYPCNHASFSPTGNVMASCDCHGIINLWDIRQPALPISTVVAGPMAANQVSFSPAGKRLVVACSDSLVRIVEVNSCEVSVLTGHTDDVQSVTFDHKGESVMSAGRDGIINIWSCREC